MVQGELVDACQEFGAGLESPAHAGCVRVARSGSDCLGVRAEIQGICLREHPAAVVATEPAGRGPVIA